MSDAYTAVAEGADAAYWNPAGLSFVEGGQIMLGHFSWYQDLNIEQGAVAYSVGENITIAGLMTYLSYGTMEGFDLEGNSTGQLNAYDWVGTIAVGYQATDKLSIGLSGKYVLQQLDDISGSAFVADLGMRLQLGRFTLAATAANLGGDMSFGSVKEKLPAAFRLGVAVRPFTDLFVTSLELEKYRYGQPVLRQGVEFNFRERYFLRAGYNLSMEKIEGDQGTGFAMGAGVLLDRVRFDYAYTIDDRYTSDNLHRFTLGLSF